MIELELYKEDLEVAAEMFAKLEELAAMAHVYEIEIRFRADDGPWITVGYGEAGDPCVLKIEPSYVTPIPPPLNDLYRTGPHTFTINEADYNSL